VTAGVTGKSAVSPAETPVEADQYFPKSAIPEQMRINVPKALAQALHEVPERWRSRGFAAAVFGGLGSAPSASEFVSAAVQLERAGLILRLALHLGLSGRIEKDARRVIRWIDRACSHRRDDGISMRLRLPPVHALALMQLKPRARGEFVQLVLSCARGRISLHGLVADEYRIRIACDCIVWHLESDSTVIPVAEIVPLLIAIEGLRQGGSP
jgi:hypothetical protein